MDDKEDIAFRDMDTALDETQCDTIEELKDAAFEVLLLNPGCEHCDWVNILVNQYGLELVDAYGTNPADVHEEMDNLWESPYYDSRSRLEYDFKTWAEAFATDAAVQMYYDLIWNKQ